jgi:hypothetical protein
MWFRPTTWRGVSCTMRRRGGPFPAPPTGTTCSRYARRPTSGYCHMMSVGPTIDRSTHPIIQLGYDMERICYPAWFEALGREAGLAYRDVFPNKVRRGTDRRESTYHTHDSRSGYIHLSNTGRPARGAHGAGLCGFGAGNGARSRLPGGGRDDGQHRVSRAVCR